MDALGLLGSAVHVVNGDGVGGIVRDAGAGDIVVYADNLTYGPCSRMPAEHARQRGRFRSLVQQTVLSVVPLSRPQVRTGDDLRRAIGCRAPQVIVWSSATWEDLLYEAWVVDTLLRQGFAPETLHIVMLPGNRASPERHLREEVLCVVRNAKTLDRRAARQRTRVWAAFASPTPRAFREALHSHVVGEESTRTTYEESYAALLPRVTGQSNPRLWLSEVDEVLLRSLSTSEWRNTGSMLRQEATRTSLYEVMALLGDLFVTYRLSAWTPDRAVERRVVNGPARLVPDLEFRLTSVGAELLTRGIPARRRVPPLFLGGYNIYASKSVWAARRHGGRVKLVQLN